MDPSIVLLVEEPSDGRASLERAFLQEGFTVRTASTGPESIELILKEKPAFVVFDSTSPGISGTDLCRVIKEDPFLRDIVLIVTSANPDLEKRLSTLEEGANDFLVKPVDSREIVARVRNFGHLMDEIRLASNPGANLDIEPQQTIHMPMIPEKDKSYPTVDFVGAPTASDASIRIRPRYGVYRVENLIGSGAMGHVFKAYDEPLERFVAIKILSKRLSSSPAFVERFRREAKVLAAINHPGIAFVYSFGEEDGEHYFAIQWCSGGSVADLIRKKQRVDILPAMDIVLQSARGLEAASRKGVVHRDIKPSNILFDENQQVKIVDFGLASSEKMSARITQVQEFLGTPSFMAPEQAQSASVDPRADIYSLGITFYYMLYGKLPFTASTAIEMVIKHASQPFPAYESLDGRVPKSAFAVIERMTRKNPDERYPDYAALIQDLEQLRNELLQQSHWKIPRALGVEPVASMKSDSLFELLSNIYLQGPSGVLTVRWGNLQKLFLFRQREVIFFESTQQDENIWQVMVQKNLLKKEDIPDRTEDTETSLNRYLLDRRLTMQEFKVAYRDLMKAALMQVFFWPVFEGDFALAAIEHDAFSSIRASEVMLESARNLIAYDTIRKQIPATLAVSRTSTFESVLSTLNLKPEESFIASRIEDQETTLETLQLLTGLPEERVARFVYALQKMGALQFKTAEARRQQRKQETPAPPPPAPPPPAPPPAAPMTPVVEVTRQSSSGSEAIKPRQPFFDVAARKLVEIPPDQAITESPVAPQVRIEVNRPDKTFEADHQKRVAEQFFRLAEEKFEWGDYWNVTQLCKQAIKNYPAESRYYHLMARAYAKHPRFGKDAEQFFYKALEMDPRNADYHVDFAYFYLNNGLHKRALTEVQKAVKLSPDSEKVQKLHRELKDLMDASE